MMMISVCEQVGLHIGRNFITNNDACQEFPLIKQEMKTKLLVISNFYTFK